MRGSHIDLRDIILQEEPENIDLRCDEILQEEEEEQQVHGLISRQAFQVAICCGLCQRPIKFVCLTTILALRQLEQLLFGPLDFVCVRCVNTHELHHGG
ncbi:putative E7 oncogenic protein [Rhinolophus ferrumequinum papillomavirus 1]|uniref:Protein E7 n=1 Tax=Rhinolophus ferrumequinum papillomavirus 1 TaxID=1464074 RepID=W8EH64_9PAPI|nr:putative E7 oncogenic protein [Rhinolophus ferrumequinum papillomavirus 1]AHJ81403.1 putative E7 oncogenic protein [Rhinolophus ferrumequinum papillomavirus 1]